MESGEFHWKNGWYFKRLSDATVGIRNEDQNILLIIPANEWASIVCAVSALGETGERWNEAQDFHGRPPVTRPDRGDAS